LLFVVSSFVYYVPCIAQSYSPTGIYLTLAKDELFTVSQLFTKDVNTFLTNYRQEAVNGSSSSITYKFWSFAFQVELDAFEYSSPSANAVTFGWNAVQFTIQFDYKICAKAWPNPCEDGHITVTTPNYNQKTVDASGVLLLNADKASFQLSSVALNAEDGDIAVWVQCKNAVCAIPTGDIAKAVTNELHPTFEKAASAAIQTVATKYVDKLSLQLNLPIGGASLVFNAESNWYVLPGGLTPEIILAPMGEVLVKENGNVVPPPFSPAFQVPDSVLQNPTKQLNMYFTEYLFSVISWGVEEAGLLTRQISNNEVPSNSPVKLLTNDDFFQQAVPGLNAYPNMYINVTTKPSTFAPVIIDTKGVHLSGSAIAMTFTVYNSSYSFAGWSLVMTTYADLDFNVSLVSNELTFAASVANFNPNVTFTQTQFPNISSDYFVSLFQLVVPLLKPKPFSVKLPAGLTMSDVEYSPASHYVQVSANYVYVPKTLAAPTRPAATPLSNTFHAQLN